MFRAGVLGLVLAVVLLSSCKDETDDKYNPVVNSVQDLQFEYIKISKGLENELAVLDTIQSDFLAERSVHTYRALWPGFEVLLEKGSALYSKDLSQSDAERLDNIIEGIEVRLGQAEKKDADFQKVLERGINLLTSFNVLKTFIDDPNFYEEFVVNKNVEAAGLLKNSGFMDEIGYFSERNDYDLFKLLALHFTFVKDNLYPFAVEAVDLYQIRTYAPNLKNPTSLNEKYALINNDANYERNQKLYNFSIRKITRLIEGNRPAEFIELATFAARVDDLYILRSNFSGWQKMHAKMFQQADEVMAVSDSLKNTVEVAEKVVGYNELFSLIYPSDSLEFHQLKLFAANAQLDCNWLIDYNLLQEDVEALFVKYIEGQETPGAADRVVIEQLNSRKETLLSTYEENFVVMRYSFSNLYMQLMYEEGNVLGDKIIQLNNLLSTAD